MKRIIALILLSIVVTGCTFEGNLHSYRNTGEYRDQAVEMV